MLHYEVCPQGISHSLVTYLIYIVL